MTARPISAIQQATRVRPNTDCFRSHRLDRARARSIALTAGAPQREVPMRLGWLEGQARPRPY